MCVPASRLDGITKSNTCRLLHNTVSWEKSITLNKWARTSPRNVHVTDALRPLLNSCLSLQTQHFNANLGLPFLQYHPVYTFTNSCKLDYLPVQFPPPTGFTTFKYPTKQLQSLLRRQQFDLFASKVIIFFLLSTVSWSPCSSMWRWTTMTQ